MFNFDTSRNLGAYHIANNGTEYVPQKKNNFMLIVHDINDIARVGSIIGENSPEDIIADGQSQIYIGLRSSDVPVITQQPTEISRFNSTIKFAGKPQFNTINFTAYDYIGSDVKDTLLAWQNLSYNGRYDFVGRARNYKKNCQLLQLTPDGDIVRYWDIYGAWLQSVTPGGFDMTSDDAQDVSAEMVYDWAEFHTPDDFVATI